MYSSKRLRRRVPFTGSKLIGNLMSALIDIQKYLRRGRPLTGLQVESLSLALEMGKTFLAVWKAAKGYKKKSREKNMSGRSSLVHAMEMGGVSMGKSKDPRIRNWAAVLLGRKGGLKGGNARAKKLSPERRAAIATLAVKARWARRNALKGKNNR
jgi:hypothetical protein